MPSLAEMPAALTERRHNCAVRKLDGTRGGLRGRAVSGHLGCRRPRQPRRKREPQGRTARAEFASVEKLLVHCVTSRIIRVGAAIVAAMKVCAATPHRTSRGEIGPCYE